MGQTRTLCMWSSPSLSLFFSFSSKAYFSTSSLDQVMPLRALEVNIWTFHLEISLADLNLNSQPQPHLTSRRCCLSRQQREFSMLSPSPPPSSPSAWALPSWQKFFLLSLCQIWIILFYYFETRILTWGADPVIQSFYSLTFLKAVILILSKVVTTKQSIIM